MRFLLLLLTLLFSSGSLRAETCRPSAEQTILKCEITVKSYSQPLWLFIKRSEPTEFETFTAVLHFHGIYSSPKKLNSFKFETQLTAVAGNTILIVPLSRGANRDFKNLVASRSRLNLFLTQVAKSSAVTFNKNLLITAHSGGYIPAARALTLLKSQVRAIALFDSLYRKNETQIFNRFIRSNRPFASLYRPGTGTEKYNLRLIKLNTDDGAPTSNLEIETVDLTGANTPLIVSTSSDHYKLVRLWYGDVLEWLLKQ